MSKGIVKTIVLGAVFVVAVILFSFAMNHTNEDLTTEMKEATLPVVTFYCGDTAVNELFGYATEMEASYMRDSITPVDTNRILPMKVQTYGYPVDGISYEIRSMDTKRLIADSDVTEYTSEKGEICADLEIQNLLQSAEEYLFILKLLSGDQTLYYYTRLIEPADCYVKESLDFVLDFHETTFHKAAAGTLALYIEPNASGDNSTLHKVDIHSTLNQITWADFNGQRLGETKVSIKEINTSYNVIQLSYVVASKGDNGELEYFDARENYRVRYTPERMYLLNFDREMDQIFRGENDNFYSNHIQLGIRDADISYMANEMGDIVCFVQEGELWSYHASEQRLSKVFSFRGYEGIDSRENNPHHDIRIMKVDETGSTDFVVYGYMNRGLHEGEVGISVCHYSSVENTVEEELFLPYTRSYEIMKAELGQMMYENEKNEFYILLGGSLYEISMDTMEYRVLTDGLKEHSCAVSDSNQYIAWLKGSDTSRGTAIEVHNLETGTSFEVKADAGEYIRPLGFMENDLIYGMAKAGDIVRNQEENTIFPMYRVCILDTESEGGSILKEYQKNGYYVSGIEISDYTIYLKRIVNNGTAYVSADVDTIMNREAETEKTVDTDLTVTDVLQTQYQLVLKTKSELGSDRLLTPREIVPDSSRELMLTREAGADCYYAYANGEVLAVTDSAAEAVSRANEAAGVVLDDSQRYIFKRARKSYQKPVSVSVNEADAAEQPITKCLGALLKLEEINVGVRELADRGDTPQKIMSETMQEMTVLDLTGCEMDALLYYVNLETPVFAMSSAEDAVLITGYDSGTVTVFDASQGVARRIDMEEAKELFEEAGNVFVAYLRG